MKIRTAELELFVRDIFFTISCAYIFSSVNFNLNNQEQFKTN